MLYACYVVVYVLKVFLAFLYEHHRCHDYALQCYICVVELMALHVLLTCSTYVQSCVLHDCAFCLVFDMFRACCYRLYTHAQDSCMFYIDGIRCY